MSGVRNHENLIAWQLCEELKKKVFAFTGRRPACSDFKLCNQIRSAAASATDRIAEGFYRYYSRDFARFCAMTRGSLGEIKNQLLHARKRGYLDQTDYDEISGLARRTMAATTKPHNYLRNCAPR